MNLNKLGFDQKLNKNWWDDMYSSSLENFTTKIKPEKISKFEKDKTDKTKISLKKYKSKGKLARIKKEDEILNSIVKKSEKKEKI